MGALLLTTALLRGYAVTARTPMAALCRVDIRPVTLIAGENAVAEIRYKRSKGPMRTSTSRATRDIEIEPIRVSIAAAKHCRIKALFLWPRSLLPASRRSCCGALTVA